MSHVPVLLSEVLDHLTPKDGGIYVDATFGRGGYTKGILEAADCTVIAIDRDESAILYGENEFRKELEVLSNSALSKKGLSEKGLETAHQKEAQPAPENNKSLSPVYPENRLKLIHGRFSSLDSLLSSHNIHEIDGIVFDLGVSSPQLDEATRGFSFAKDGPLDMRMGLASDSAADLVNTATEKDLADILYKYGEEKNARRIARTIVEARKDTPIETTLQLVKLVHQVNRPRHNDKIDPATRTFQGLRIAVNEELQEIETALTASEKVLKPDGALVVVSFHSLEDRIVKIFLQERSFVETSRLLPGETPATPPSFKLLTKKPVVADEDETTLNPRARSAKLRAATRTTNPVWRHAA